MESLNNQQIIEQYNNSGTMLNEILNTGLYRHNQVLHGRVIHGNV